METKGKQTRLVDAAGDDLVALLSPVAPQTFVNEYWGRKPLYVKGFREKYKGFFDGAAFIQAVSTPSRVPGDFLRASFDKKTPAAKSAAGEPADLTQAFPISAELAGPLFEAGATLCLTDIDTRVPRLAHFVAAIKRQLGYPGRVSFNAYLSAPGSGLNWHFDGRIASTLQIEGSKKWRFSNRVAIEWPRGNGAHMTDGSARYADSKTTPRAEWERLAPLDKNAVTEVVLEPGDLLILPAGTWHDASGGTSGSLALNLSFNPVSYTSLIGDLLDSLLARDPGWRSPKPLIARQGGLPGEVDPRALEALKKQLENAAETLGSLAADSSALVALWSTFVQNDSPPIAIAKSAPSSAPIAPGDRFRVRADGNVYVQTAENGTKLSIAIGHTRTEAMGGAMYFVQRAIAAREFAASECFAWGVGETRLTPVDVEQVLAHLVNEGLLERVTR
jgi:ribosomal protein L16 Arg81 hydroxylase